MRKLTDNEQIEMLYKLESVFNAEPRTYWFPLAEKKIEQAVLVLPTWITFCESVKEDGDILDLTIENINKILKEMDETFYDAGEMIDGIQEVDTFTGGYESYHWNKDFTWIVYVSHESTISFCGDALIEKVKKFCNLDKERFIKVSLKDNIFCNGLFHGGVANEEAVHELVKAAKF